MRLRFLPAAVCAFFLIQPLRAAPNGVDYLTYEEFVAEIDNGAVRSVTLDRFALLAGTHVVDARERAFKAYGDAGTANDILLLRLLKQKNVAVTLQKNQDSRLMSVFAGGTIITYLLSLVVPLTTLVLVFNINARLKRIATQPRA